MQLAWLEFTSEPYRRIELRASGRTTPNLKINSYSFWIVRSLTPVSVTASSTVVDIAYAITFTVNTFVIVSKAPDLDFVFSVLGQGFGQVTVAHGVESILAVQFNVVIDDPG